MTNPIYSTHHSITKNSLEFIGDCNPLKANTFFVISPFSEVLTVDPFNKVLDSVASIYGKQGDIVIIYDTANKIDNMRKSANLNQVFFRKSENFSFYGFNDHDSRMQEHLLQVEQMEIFLTIVDELKNLALLAGFSLEGILNFQQEMTDNIKNSLKIFTREEFASLLRDSDLEIFSNQGWIDLFYSVYLSAKISKNLSEQTINKDKINLLSLAAPILSKLGVAGIQSLMRIQTLITKDLHNITEHMISNHEKRKSAFQERVNQLKTEFPEKKIFTILPANFIVKAEVKVVMDEEGTTFRTQTGIDRTFMQDENVLVSLKFPELAALAASYGLSKFHSLGIIEGNPYPKFISKL